MVREIARHEGVLSLWRGLAPTLIMTVPATAFYFTLYQTLKLHLERQFATRDAAWSVPLVAGPVARAATVFLSSPLELARTNLQARARVLNAGRDDMWSLLSGVVRTGGVRGLLAGVVPTLWRDVPFSAFYWLFYEQALHRLRKTSFSSHNATPSSEQKFQQQQKQQQKQQQHQYQQQYQQKQQQQKDSKDDAIPHAGFLMHFLAGASAGSAASLLTHPFDVIKTRRQAHLAQPMGALQIARDIVREEGVVGLYRGTVPRLARVATACAIMIASYNKTLQVLYERRRRHESS